MIRAQTVRPVGTWHPTGTEDSVLLDHDGRHRRRVTLRSHGGREFLLDLAEAVRLRDGDGLGLETGETIVVRAQAEPLLDISAESAAAMVRIAWHLGNRHLPVQLIGDHLRIRADHVIAEMVTQLGGHVAPVEAPFDPEAGAYAGGHHHHHDH